LPQSFADVVSNAIAEDIGGGIAFADGSPAFSDDGDEFDLIVNVLTGLCNFDRIEGSATASPDCGGSSKTPLPVFLQRAVADGIHHLTAIQLLCCAIEPLPACLEYHDLMTGTRQLFYARLPDVKGTAGSVAFVLDEVMPASAAYRWSVNHTVAVGQPLELFPLHVIEVGT